MQQRHRIISLAVLILLTYCFTPGGSLAQDNRRLTDFREREHYTSEELGAALFPTLQTRGVFLRSTPEASGGLLRPASVVIPVFFAVNSADIMPRYYAELDKLGAQLTAPHYLSYSVKIEGHTDSRGAAHVNQILSEKRAQSVKHYLVQRFSIAPERLGTEGYGPLKPLAPNTTESGRQKNRRIEIANVAQQ
ncbi:MAG: OmpA family protein [Candidatus Tectimicrobiota bacterium]